MKHICLLLLSAALFSCQKPVIHISDLSGTSVGVHAAGEMQRYMDQLFKGVEFSKAEGDKPADIRLLLSSQEEGGDLDRGDLPVKPESFKILINEGKLNLIAADEKGLLNATYALLEKLGCGFYISGDILPGQKKWTGFGGWEMEDEPLTGDRFVFNWHNFLSGCTGWNLTDWQLWINQASKMRYNGIMVHAYGNNPMFSFEYLGEKKPTGYLNNSHSGRDWGNQHVNDVRRLVGGHIFDGPVYGADASMAAAEEKEQAATELMQQVFQYAEDRGTKVIFALDFDTWMANPRKIIEKLPREALFELGDGHLTPNPSHPEGYAYFEQVLRALLEMYPQIDQLSVWHRRPSLRPGLGTIWMNFPFQKLPEQWKREYLEIIAEHPELPNDLQATSMFAYGKLIGALQKARDRIHPTLEISSGSWQFHYVKYADAFFPKDVKLLPLDWQVVFDQEEAKSTLAKAGANRDVYPIIWAHHDDHRYIGRPYTPWENLSTMLNERNAKGFGIIHWTTHPLDLYFKNSARQVWKQTRNESSKNTVEGFVCDLLGEENPALSRYYLTWLTSGPMFGRETTDHFIDLGRQRHGKELDSWDQMKEKTLERLEMIDAIPAFKGHDILIYQQQMEAFYLSFFENQILFQKAFEHVLAGEIEEGMELMQGTDPETSIEQYVRAVEHIGFTPGEKALVFSMNTRWLADYYNLEQQLGKRPVQLLFSPTQHDPLAQAPGHYSYYIDEDGSWWRCLWENELKENTFISEGDESGMLLEDDWKFDLEAMHGQPLPEGQYRVDIWLHGISDTATPGFYQESNGKKMELEAEKSEEGYSIHVDTKNGRSVKLRARGKTVLKGIILTKL